MDLLSTLLSHERIPRPRDNFCAKEKARFLAPLLLGLFRIYMDEEGSIDFTLIVLLLESRRPVTFTSLPSKLFAWL